MRGVHAAAGRLRRTHPKTNILTRRETGLLCRGLRGRKGGAYAPHHSKKG